MKLVEIVRGYETSQETIDKIKEVAEAFGKIIIVAKKDTPPDLL